MTKDSRHLRCLPRHGLRMPKTSALRYENLQRASAVNDIIVMDSSKLVKDKSGTNDSCFSSISTIDVLLQN